LAKNLKLKIKNTQLAAAIQLKEQKKEEAAAPPKKPKPKKIVRAALPPKEKPVVTPPPEEKEIKEVAPPAAEVEKKPEPKTTSLEDLKKREKEPVEPEKKTVGFRAQVSRGDKDFKAKKLEARQGRGFDSRDRQGLRVGEERSWRRRRPRSRMPSRRSIEIVRPSAISVRIPISIKDLAQNMKLKTSELISKLFMQGIALTINDYLDDTTTIQLLGHEFHCEITIDTSEEERLRITDKTIQQEIQETAPEDLILRAPVIAFMGHVDHGKTSLIDAIRKSNIAAGEAGAITQHIGAFKCHRESGDITILDTPGHEAFSMMRQRGAAITDVIVLVVAGDEGIMPQTDEAINKAKEANVPIVVAINKSDKPSFNADNVYRQLADRELLPEAWGGTTITINCSATSGDGMNDLLEMLALQTDVLELKANPQSRARGTVLEAQMHKGFGAVATILVQNGTLKLGDALVFENIYARVKTIHDEHGKSMLQAGPATPVKITGLSGVPDAGCEFIAVENDKEARKLCEERASGVKRSFTQRKGESLESLMERQQALAEVKVLNLILRADVQGSIEAIKSSLFAIPTEKVELNFIAEGVGEISESDVELAAASNAPIIGFHTRLESHAEELMKHSKVVIKQQNIIYHVIDDVKELMLQTLDKVRQENEMGTVLVKQLFKVSHLGVIAGGQVTEGIVKRTHRAKVFRQGEVIWEGEIASLKRVKEDAKEVSKGLECGVLLNRFNDVEIDDEIKTFEITYIQQEL